MNVLEAVVISQVLIKTGVNKFGKDYKQFSLKCGQECYYGFIGVGIESPEEGAIVNMLVETEGKFKQVKKLEILIKGDITMTKKSSDSKSLDSKSLDSKKEFKKVEVTGIAMYAMVHKPKKPYVEGDSSQYTLDLVVEDDVADVLIKEGLKPSKVLIDEDTKKLKEYSEYPGKKVFILRRKTVKRDGTLNTPLEVVDGSLNRIPPTILIGNGSKVRVLINPYTVEFKGKMVSGHTLLGVQVITLVPYVSSKDKPSFSKYEGAYTVDESSVSSSFIDEAEQYLSKDL